MTGPVKSEGPLVGSVSSEGGAAALGGEAALLSFPNCSHPLGQNALLQTEDGVTV